MSRVIGPRFDLAYDFLDTSESMSTALEKVVSTGRVEKDQFPDAVVKNAQRFLDLVLDEGALSIYGDNLRRNSNPLATVKAFLFMFEFMRDNQILQECLPFLETYKKIHLRTRDYHEFLQTLYSSRELNNHCKELSRELKGLFGKMEEEGRNYDPDFPGPYSYEL